MIKLYFVNVDRGHYLDGSIVVIDFTDNFTKMNYEGLEYRSKTMDAIIDLNSCI